MKIQLRLTKEDQSNPLALNVPYIRALKDKGIEFVKDHEDFILIHAAVLDDNILNTKTPIAILERTDSANIIRKNELKLPHVLGVIKNTILRPESLNNAPYYYGRYHNKVMWDLMPQKNEHPYNISLTETIPPITNEDMKKILCGYSFCHYNKLDAFASARVHLNTPRSNDIHFVGTTDYGTNLVSTYHRTLALKKINELRNVIKIAGNGRLHPAPQYINELLNTKIVVSPWGHGEACYRDFEALFCGCILLKPDSSFVKCWPDIYDNDKTYIPCKADFSDLQDKVNWIKINWVKLTDMRERNMKMVLDARRPENFANHMSEVFNECFKRLNK